MDMYFFVFYFCYYLYVMVRNELELFFSCMILVLLMYYVVLAYRAYFG